MEFALAADGKTAAVSFSQWRAAGGLGVAQVSPFRRRKANSARCDFCRIRARLIAADRGERRLSLYDVPSARLITHLPLAVRPDHSMFNRGRRTGVEPIVYHRRGHGCRGGGVSVSHAGSGRDGAGGACSGTHGGVSAYLFVASPASGDVNILEINSRKVVAVASVGADPGFIAVTPDDQYALVLNRKSGDVAVLRVGAITKNRYKTASLLTVIPVGGNPVSAAVRGV